MPVCDQHGAQMVDAADAGEMAVGGRAEAGDLAGKGLSGLPPSVCTRLTQSIVFFTSGGIEPLYSGVADQHRVMGGDQPGQLHGVFRDALFALRDPGP